jgi:hypothetical protein
MRSLSDADLQAVLGLLVSIVTTFLTVSYVVSCTTEGLGSLLRWRQKLLLRGIKDMLDDPKFEHLARDIYIDSRVNPRLKAGDTVFSESQLNAMPASIEPMVFADALMRASGLADPETGALKSLDAMKGAVTAADSKIRSREIRRLALILINRVRAPAEVQRHLADWFVQAMAEMTIAYRHRTQLSNFITGFFLAAVLDLEPIPLGTGPLAGAATAAGAGTVSTMAILTSVFEWLVVAMSTLFGAQFWFSMLKKVTGQSTDGTKGAGAQGTVQSPSGGGPATGAPAPGSGGVAAPADSAASAGSASSGPGGTPPPAGGGAPAR